MTTETNHLKTRLLTINQFLLEHPFNTNGGLRALIFNGKNTGFDRVVKRIGRKVLIDENKFFEWVEEKNGGNNA